MFKNFVYDRDKLYDIFNSSIPKMIKKYLLKRNKKISLYRVDTYFEYYKKSRISIHDIYLFYRDFFELYKMGYKQAKASGFNEEYHKFQTALYPNCVSFLIIDECYNKHKIDIYKNDNFIEITNYFSHRPPENYNITSIEDDGNIFFEDIEIKLFTGIKYFIQKYLESYELK